MFTQDEKTNSLYEKAIKKSDSRDISTEYTLPDYLPDITRLLRVSAKAEHPEKYCSAESVEYDGKVIYNILYATSEGEIRCAVFDADYTGAVNAQEINDFSVVDVSVSTESVNCRLSSPRKLTVKCRLFANISICNAKNTEPAISGKTSPDAEKDLQYRKRLLEFCREIKAEEKNTPISEDIETDPGMPQIARIVFLNLTPAAFDVRTSEGKINYNGALTAEVLYEGENGEYVSLSREVPLSGTLEADGVTEDSVAFCDAEATNVTYRPQTGELGETKTIELDFDYSVYFRVFRKDLCEITTDIYSLSYENSNEKETLRYLTLDAGKVFNFSFNESTDFEEKEFSRVVCTRAQATVGSVKKSGAKTAVGGNVSFSDILGGENGAFIGKTFNFPFKAETDAGRYAELFCYIAKACTGGVGARIVGEKIYFDTEITVSLALFGEKDEEALRSCTIFTDHPIEALPSSQIVLYYPMRGEDLWSVAKKYNTTVEKLSALNGGAKEPLGGGVLIIPN
ncbi:MAG: DUF3794 domain-containing protein [Clostridia bacterium]|nr:DUF3794 domain-containing protein [Clostridia bacterium]